MSITLGSGDLAMVQGTADEREIVASSYQPTCERMAQVVNPDVGNASALADAEFAAAALVRLVRSAACRSNCAIRASVARESLPPVPTKSHTIPKVRIAPARAILASGQLMAAANPERD